MRAQDGANQYGGIWGLDDRGMGKMGRYKRAIEDGWRFLEDPMAFPMINPTRRYLLNCAEWNLEMARRLKKTDPAASKWMLAQAEGLFNRADASVCDDATA